jgi:hypothetical protein
MPDPTSSQNPIAKTVTQPGPLKCLSGSLLAGSIAMLLYRLTTAISQSFAAHPIASDNQTAITISIAVRTLVVGMSTLATGIFGVAALGLIALAVQILFQRFSKSTTQPPNS